MSYWTVQDASTSIALRKKTEASKSPKKNVWIGKMTNIMRKIRIDRVFTSFEKKWKKYRYLKGRRMAHNDGKLFLNATQWFFWVTWQVGPMTRFTWFYYYVSQGIYYYGCSGCTNHRSLEDHLRLKYVVNVSAHSLKKNSGQRKLRLLSTPIYTS